jgi:biotin operon repressor
MVMAITRRQKEVIDFLSNFTQKNGYSPSYEEIASGLGLTSLATVHKHVTNLQNKGLLQRAHNRSRSIDVLPPRSSKKGFDRLPLLGRIAAGKPRRGHRDRRDHLARRHHRQPRGLRAGGPRRLHARRAHRLRGLRPGRAHRAPRAKARSSSPWSTAPTPP